MLTVQGGRFDFEDGGSYVGEWSQGRAHGLGLATGPDNQGEYSGEWLHGYETCGVYIWASGNSFAGTWLKGKRHGDGLQIKGKWVYCGAFTGGFCGRYGIKICLTSRVTYEGTWHLNQFDGYGVETSPDGSYYSGAWFKGSKHGLGIQKKLTTMPENNTQATPFEASPARTDSSETGPAQETAKPVAAGGQIASRRLLLNNSSDSSSSQPHGSSCVSRKAMLGRALMKRLKKQHSAGELIRHTPTEIPSPPAANALNQMRPELRRRMKHSSLSNTASPTLAGRLTGKTSVSETPTSPFSEAASGCSETYAGEWRDDHKNGLGVLERADGYMYIGEWMADKRHGLGVTVNSDGTIEEGRYRNDKLVLELNRRNRLQMLRHVKVKDLLEEIVQKSQSVAKEAREKAAETAQTRARLAREVAATAGSHARDARKFSDQARQVAKLLSPDMLQPGPVWEEKRQVAIARLIRKRSEHSSRQASGEAATEFAHFPLDLMPMQSRVASDEPQSFSELNTRRPYSAPVTQTGSSVALARKVQCHSGDSGKLSGERKCQLSDILQEGEEVLNLPIINKNGRLCRSTETPSLLPWDNAAVNALLQQRAQSEDRDVTTKLNVSGTRWRGSVRQSIPEDARLAKAIDKGAACEMRQARAPFDKAASEERANATADTQPGKMRHATSLQSSDVSAMESQGSLSVDCEGPVRKCSSSTAILSEEMVPKQHALKRLAKLVSEPSDTAPPVSKVTSKYSDSVDGAQSAKTRASVAFRDASRLRTRQYLRGGRLPARGVLSSHTSTQSSLSSGGGYGTHSSLRLHDSGYQSTEPGSSFSSSLFGFGNQLSRDVSVSGSSGLAHPSQHSHFSSVSPEEVLREIPSNPNDELTSISQNSPLMTELHGSQIALDVVYENNNDEITMLSVPQLNSAPGSSKLIPPEVMATDDQRTPKATHFPHVDSPPPVVPNVLPSQPGAPNHPQQPTRQAVGSPNSYEYLGHATRRSRELYEHEIAKHRLYEHSIRQSPHPRYRRLRYNPIDSTIPLHNEWEELYFDDYPDFTAMPQSAAAYRPRASSIACESYARAPRLRSCDVPGCCHFAPAYHSAGEFDESMYEMDMELQADRSMFDADPAAFDPYFMRELNYDSDSGLDSRLWNDYSHRLMLSRMDRAPVPATHKQRHFWPGQGSVGGGSGRGEFPGKIWTGGRSNQQSHLCHEASIEAPTDVSRNSSNSDCTLRHMQQQQRSSTKSSIQRTNSTCSNANPSQRKANISSQVESGSQDGETQTATEEPTAGQRAPEPELNTDDIARHMRIIAAIVHRKLCNLVREAFIRFQGSQLDVTMSHILQEHPYMVIIAAANLMIAILFLWTRKDAATVSL